MLRRFRLSHLQLVIDLKKLLESELGVKSAELAIFLKGAEEFLLHVVSKIYSLETVALISEALLAQKINVTFRRLYDFESLRLFWKG